MLYVTSDLFLLVSIARSLKCCLQRRSTLMVTTEVSTLADLYCSCWRFCKMGWNCSAHVSFCHGLELLRPWFLSQWTGIAQPIFHFAMGWNCSAHFLFFCCLDATSPFFFSRWSGCNQSIFLFSMVWMQPVHFSFLGGLDATSPFFFSRWSGFSRSKSTRERDEEL